MNVQQTRNVRKMSKNSITLSIGMMVILKYELAALDYIKQAKSSPYLSIALL